MPLFTGRVGALSPPYSVPRLPYFDPSQSNPSIIFLYVSSLSNIQLPYDTRTPHKKCTLWEYAIRNANTFVMPSLASVKRRVGEALDMAIKEDDEFWATINETGDKIIIFQNSHWFWGRYRPGDDIYWSGRNELGELLMLVRDSHRASLARLMPLEPFPLSSNASNSPSIVLAPRSPGIIASSTRRPISISLPGGSQRPLSLMSMDRIPSGPFSRLATSPVAAESGLEGSYSPLFGLADPGTPTFEDASVLPFIVDPESSQGISDLRPSSVPIRSPRSTVSSSGFTPPPPYTSTPGTPSHESFDFLPLPNLRAGSSARLPSGRMNSPSHDLRRYSPLAVQQSQTLPHRVRLVPVDEDSEMAALNRLREEYQRNNLRNKDRLVSDYDISVLRNLNARRLNRQEIAEVQRKLREAEKEKMNAEAILGRRGLHQPYSGLNDYSMMMPPSAAVQRSDESGALRVREIEARIMAHRKAMRHHQDTRREREIERIERLGAGRDRRYSMPPLL